LAIPLFYEQQLTARRIQSNGWGVVCDPNEPNQFGAAIDRLLGDDGFAKRCIAAAAQLDFGTNAFNEATKWFDERMETLH